MDKCKNTFIVTSGKTRKALPFLAAVAVAGCGGGGSGGGDGGDPTGTSSLSDSQKAVAAAYTIAGQANSLSDQAVNQASGAADTGGTVDSQSFSAANTQDPFDECARIENSVDAGFLTQEGEVLDVSAITTFPAPFTQPANDSLGQKEDAVGRANCTIDQLNVLGAYDIAQREGIGGDPGKRLVFAEAGGLGDASLSFAVPPDVSKSMELETSATSLSIPTLRYRMHICNGCVGGDLSDWTGDPDIDITSVAFIELETVISGNSSYVKMGSTPDEPFVLQTAPGGAGDVQVDVDGEYQVTNGGAEGCTLGATISTENSGPLFVDSFVDDNAAPTGGAIDITPTGSGETFRVEFVPGGPLVNGQPVSEQDLTAVNNCGFVAESST